ncbi:hypothetical protein C357_03605, partial [Citreicella sp. 357]
PRNETYRGGTTWIWGMMSASAIPHETAVSIGFEMAPHVAGHGDSRLLAGRDVAGAGKAAPRSRPAIAPRRARHRG